mgnify:CR=1 FL=1
MASDRQQDLGEVRDELEQRGARNVDVGGTVGLHAYGDEDSPGGSVQVEYTGDPETVRHAVAEVDRVRVDSVDSQEWPGGDTLVTAEIALLEGGSPGANPRGRVDTSGGSSTVPPPAENEATQDPHVAPGGTWAIEDENGIPDEYEVEVWPVRWWEPRPDVPAVSVLRYIPHPVAEGKEWWAGYVRLAPEDGAGSIDWQGMRNQVDATSYRSDHPPLSYHDGHGWVGWKEQDLDHRPDNYEAGDLTEALAQAALEARREVLG